MTSPVDPRGRWFISYKREDKEEARRLTIALNARGIPTWLDTSDLGHEPTHDALRAAIQDSGTAGALLLATPRVSASSTIRLVEAPEILKRRRFDPSFQVLPIASDLEYNDVAAAYGDGIADHDLSKWNIYKTANGPLSNGDACEVARRILETRLRAVDRMLSDGEPLEVLLHTRERAPTSASMALTIDWSSHFDPRHCEPETWSDVLLPALADVGSAVGRVTPQRSIVVSGLLSIPAAIAIGASFPTTRGIPMQWRQRASDTLEQLWSLNVVPVSVRLSVHSESRDIEARDIAVLLSVTGDVRPDFARTVHSLAPLRCLVDAWLDPFTRSLDAGEARAIATAVSDAVRAARSDYRATGRVHVFFAGPVGLAAMFGQLLNTFHEVVTYEYEGSSDIPYRQAAIIVNR